MSRFLDNPALQFIWFPVLFFAAQFAGLSLASNEQPSEHRQTVYRTSFVCTFLCFVLSLWSRLRLNNFAQFKKCGSWGNVTALAATITLVAVLFYTTPRVVVDMYASVCLPLLAIPWMLLQAYAVLLCTLKVHAMLTSTVRSVAERSQQTVATFFLNKGLAIPSIKVIMVGYLIIFGACAAVAIVPWCSSLFPGSIGGSVLLCTLLGACVVTYYSVRWEVNRGLLVPAVVILYTATLVIGILQVDPGNYHSSAAFEGEGHLLPSEDASYSSAVHAQHAVEAVAHSASIVVAAPAPPHWQQQQQHEGALHQYEWANDVRLWVICAVTVGYYVLNYRECCIADVRKGFRKAAACWHCRTGAIKTRMVEDEVIAVAGEDSNTEVADQEGLLTGEMPTISRWGARSSILGASTSLDLESGANTQQVESGDSGSARGKSPATSSPEDYLTAHYVRMLLLVGYSALLLTRWRPANGAEWVAWSALDSMSPAARQAAASTLSQQYYVLGMQLLGWLLVWGMYAYALYSAYAVNCRYRQTRMLMFERDFAHSKTAEVLECEVGSVQECRDNTT